MNINVTRPFLPPLEEYEQLLKRIWDTNWLTNNGPLLMEFQSQLKEYLGLERIQLTVNGHLALEIAIHSLGLSGEVITTPFTFASTTHSIVRQGLKPVFCDIRPDDYTIDADKIESLITEKTSAILPVHVYGFPCQVEKIEEIARKHNLAVLYDAAHTFGVRYRGRSLCDYGDCSILSFHATKLFHSIEGGAVIPHSDALAARVEEEKNYGILDEQLVVSPGGNAKMNEFQASMGILNLRYIDRLIEERKQLTAHYHALLREIPGIRFHTPVSKEIEYNYAYLPVLIDQDTYGKSRDALYLELKKHGVNSRKYFFPLTSDFECYRHLDSGDTPIAKSISDSVLCLPIYNGLSLQEIESICTIVSDFGKPTP